MSQFLFHRPDPTWFPESLRSCTLVTDMNQRPIPARMKWDEDKMTLEMLEDPSGRVQVMVPTQDGGAALLATPWLFPKWSGYCLEVELLRGLISRIRTAAELWRANKLGLPADYAESMQRMTSQFIQIWQRSRKEFPAADGLKLLHRLLKLSDRISDQLLDRQGQSVLSDTESRENGKSGGFLLGARFQLETNGTTQASESEVPLQSFCDSSVLNWVNLHRPWHSEAGQAQVQTFEANRHLESVIQKLKQARKQVVVGPLFDITRDRFQPEQGTSDFTDSLRVALTGSLQSLLPQIAADIGLMHVVGGINGIGANGLTPTVQGDLVIEALESANMIAPYTQLMISFDQPFCERHAWSVGGQTPEYFLTKLLKQRTPLHAIGLELNLGYFPRGTLPRIALDWVMQMHSWAIWEVPIYLIIRFPGEFESQSRRQSFPALPGGADATRDSVSVARELVRLFSSLPWIHGILFPGVTDPDPVYPEAIAGDSDQALQLQSLLLGHNGHKS